MTNKFSENYFKVYLKFVFITQFNMENRKLIEALRATLDPNQRAQAEQQLSQVK